MKKSQYSLNPVLRYIIYTFLVLFVGTGAMVYVVSNLFESYVIQSHIAVYPNLLEVISDSNPSIREYFMRSDVQSMDMKGNELFSPLLKVGNVFRIKIWNTEGMVLWSDEPKNIGTYTVPDDSFMAALEGTAVYSIQEPQPIENQYEDNKGFLLEIYAPVKAGNQTLGIIEFYESTQELAKALTTGKMLIVGTGVIFGILLYLLQFSIFYRSHQRQRKLSDQLVRAKDSTLFALASLAENRDSDTGRHIERTSEYVSLIATKLRESSAYQDRLNMPYIHEIVKAAPLHDIGKVGIPDAILLKPGPLSAEEFEVMKTHTEIGAKTLIGAEAKLESNAYLNYAIEIALHHHEKWNGEGYPKKLKGEEIPLSARIMAVADVYDALRSQRPYKSGFSHEKAYEIITKDSGTHFDPEIIRIFIANQHAMAAIFDAHQDNESHQLGL